MKNKKIILITGCSSGFGFLTSKLLSNDENFVVCASMRNLGKKEELLNAANKIELFEIDVTKPETIKIAVAKIIEKYGKIDVLINNAGFALGGFFEDLSDQEIRGQMDTNFFGVQNMIREVLPSMHNQKQGKIINISSIAGKVGYPSLGAYNASKFALEGFCESLHLELLPFNIQVLLVEPGSFQTKIFEENAKFPQITKSKYSEYTKYLIETRIKKLSKIRPNPIKVAKVVVNLVNAENPRFRTMIGFDAKITYLLKQILPFKLFAKIVNFFALRKA